MIFGAKTKGLAGERGAIETAHYDRPFFDLPPPMDSCAILSPTHVYLRKPTRTAYTHGLRFAVVEKPEGTGEENEPPIQQSPPCFDMACVRIPHTPSMYLLPPPDSENRRVVKLEFCTRPVGASVSGAWALLPAALRYEFGNFDSLTYTYGSSSRCDTEFLKAHLPVEFIVVVNCPAPAYVTVINFNERASEAVKMQGRTMAANERVILNSSTIFEFCGRMITLQYD